VTAQAANRTFPKILPGGRDTKRTRVPFAPASIAFDTLPERARKPYDCEHPPTGPDLHIAAEHAVRRYGAAAHRFNALRQIPALAFPKSHRVEQGHEHFLISELEAWEIEMGVLGGATFSFLQAMIAE
jgi:hypothetical protein